MKPSTLLMTLLVLANVLVLAGGLVLYEEPNDDSLSLLGLAIAQAGLLATWLALGRTKASLRLIGISAAMLLLDVALKKCWPAFEVLTDVFLVSIVVIFTILLVMRMLGLRLTNEHTEALEPNTVPGQPRFQFTLRQMFGWTTAVAVLCSALTTISFREIVTSLPYMTVFVFVLVLSSLFPLLVSLWAVLGMRKLASRFVLLALVYLLALPAYIGLLDAPAGDALAVCGTTGVVLLGSLVVCRVAGYRIGWRRQRQSDV